MAKKIRLWINENHSWLSRILIISGLIFYLTQSIFFSRTIPSTVWDEGMYVYKGYLFASGEYIPFEDSGPWTNQMPFAYFLSGIPQVWFGVGFRTGRNLAVALGVLSLLALAMAANRLGGKWWSAVTVWTVALNTGWVMAFSQLFSQGMVSFLLAWTVYFVCGKEPKKWELAAAVFFVGLTGMVRINMLPLAFLLVAYVFWQHGRKTGFLTLVVALTPIIFFHVLYWPEILKIWAYWIPENLFPGIAEFRSPWRENFLPADFSWLSFGHWWSDPNHMAWDGIGALVDAIRANFSVFFGSLGTIALLLTKKQWRSERDRKMVVFLLGSYVVFLVIHFYVALGGKTCVFVCLPGYMLFFNWLGLLGIVASSSSLPRTTKTWVYLVLIALVFLSLVAFEYRLENNFRSIRSLLVFDILGADKNELIDPESGVGADKPFWEFLETNIGFDRIRWLRFIWLNDFLTRSLWWIVPAVIVFVIPSILYKIADRFTHIKLDYRMFSLIAILVIGTGFASNDLFDQPMQVDYCDTNVISQIEQIGEQLHSEILPGSLVFWDVKSSLPLSYLPEIDLFLPQLNHRFTLVRDDEADPAVLDRFGWWNVPMGEEWISQADYMVVEQRFYDSLWRWDQRVSTGAYRLIMETEPVNPCVGDPTRLLVLRPYP